jgi:hypothetical protein
VPVADAGPDELPRHRQVRHLTGVHDDGSNGTRVTEEHIRHAAVEPDPQARPTVAAPKLTVAFSLSGFVNKYPQDSRRWVSTSFILGEGDYSQATMLFPTPSTLLVAGLAPGPTKGVLQPKKLGVEASILDGDRDVTETGLVTTAGSELDGLVIVVGDAAADADSE